MTATSTMMSASTPRSRWRLATSTIAALASANAANALAYLAGSSVGLFPADARIRSLDAPITLVRVFVATTVGVTLAFAAFAVIRRFSAWPYRVFRAIAIAVLLASFTQPPLALVNAPVRMIIALNVLHIIAAVTVLRTIRRSAED
jgi:hypothetical protein